MRKKGLSRRNRDGFGVAPILYMLGLIGVGAGVLFSGYSQSLKNNIQLTNSVSVKSDLDSAATTMAATSVLSGDGTVLCPPQGGAAGSNCVSGYDDNAQFSTNQDKKLIDFYQTGIGAVGTLASDPHMPSGYATSYAAGSPVEVGVFASGSGFKQLDPWGHYYIVCRWENTAQSGSNAFQVISAGADGILQTSCNETGSSPAAGHDDQVVSMDAANAINRAAVWQAGTIGTTGVAQVQFGTSGVSADAQGNLIVPNNLKIGSAGIAGSGNITLDDNGTLTGNLAGGTVSGTTASFSSAIAGQSYITADSYITSGSYISATGGLMAEGSTFNVTAGGAVSAAGGAFAVDSSGDLTSTGNVTIGSSNFVVTGSTGDTNILGIVTIGSATSTVPSNPALVANGAVNIGTQIKSGTATALLSVGTSTGSGPSKTYMFSVDQYGDIYSGGSSSVINGSLGGSFNGAVTASSLTATSLTSITGAIGAWSTTGNITTVGTITATNFSGNFTGTVNLGGGSGGATVSGVLPLANGGTGYAASSNIDLMNEMGITSSGYLNTALLTGNLIPGADLVNNSVTSMQLNNITSPGTYNSVVVGSDGRITSGSYTPIGTNQLNDGSGDTITAGTTGLLFDLGSTQEGIWTTTGLGIGTTAPGAALDVNGNVRIENAGEPAGTTSPNQLQLMSGAASERWSFTTDGSTESSGNNGSNFVLNSYTNAGALLATPLIINRATSAATFAGTVAATEFIGSGSGLTNIGTGAIVGTVGPGNGGTGTSTVFTPGSVVFAGTSGIYAQNNANFFWDNTNERLGIGTATPGQPLDIVGNARLSGNVQFGTGQQLIPVSSTRMAVQPISGNNESDFVIEPSGSNTNSYLYLAGNNSFGASTSYGFVTMNGTNMSVGNFAPAGSLTFETNNTAQMTIGSTGKIGIGTAVANSLLQIYQGEVQVGSSGTGCSSANAGAIRYSAATIYYCDGVSTWQTVYGSGGSVSAGVNLGTSAATTNPQRSGQPGTGLYSANSGEVDVAGSGVQIAAFTSGGINIATGGLNIGGVNGVSFPLDYITDASIAIGLGALASQVAAGATQGNTAIGYQTLGSTGLTTAATGNTGVGYQALAANTSGNNNTALGGTALPANTTGTYNTATGASALHYNTTGFSNTANGALALNLNTTGNSDTAVGYAALPTTSASGDTGVGYDVGYNVTGTNNSLFGASVGGNLTSGSGNILVGIGGATTAGGADVPSPSANNFLNIGNTLEGNMANANAVGRETLYLNSVASSVNYVQMSGGATGTGPTLAAAGTDTNVNLTISPQGAGSVLVPAGSIGIGTGTPNSLVQAYSGEVQVGSSGNSCTASRAGALRYAGGSAYVCDGANWDIIGGSAGGTLPSLTNGDIWVGNASNVATAVALTQDVTITNAGVATVGKIQNVAVGVPTGTAGTAVVLAGSPTLTGTLQAANITMSGEEALTLAADYTTTGSQADVVLATASAVRYNGSAAATFTGIVAGTSGQILYLHNASASTLTLSDQSDSTDGTAANKIITGTGTDLKVPTNTSVTLQYDGMGNRWRVTGSSNSANTLAAGSTGQVQFNGGANLAANANFFWDNTNFRLGIGTSAAPVNKLDIYGGVAIGTSYAGVSTAPTNGMIVLGSTGIGTASPGYLLHVYNPGQASTGVPVDGMAVEIGSPTSGTRAGYGPSIIFKDAGISVNSMARIAAIYETVGPVSAGALSFYTNPASPNALVERMRISNAGLVGIGSTTPLVSLDLSQKSDAIALPVGTNGNRPTGTNLASGEIRYNTATPAAVEYYNGTTWVPLDSSGTSIGSGLVLGTSLTALNPTRNGDTTTGLYSANAGEVDVAGSGVQTAAITGTGITINGQGAQTLGLFRETTAATAGNNLTVQAGGAVSVGTNLNGGNLILASGIATGTGSSNIQFNTYNAGSTGTTDDAAFTALTLSATGATGTNAATTLQANAGSGTNQNGGTLTLASGVSTGTGTSNISFNVYGIGTTGATANSATTAMTIASTGYVGIGTIAPTAFLDVRGNARFVVAGQGDLVILQAGGVSTIEGNGGTPLALGANATEAMRITTSGNVGIGTTSPAFPLEVAGTGALTTLVGRTQTTNANDTIYVGSTGQNFFIDRPGASGGQTIIGYNTAKGTTAQSRFQVVNNSTDHTLLFDIKSAGTSSGSNYEYLLGNVGIGSTSPVVSLDLSQKSDAIALPVGTNGNRPTGTNLASGEIRYNTATPAAVEYYNGTTWVPLDSSGTSIGSGIVLGTSVTVPNPYGSSSDTTTGLYTSGPGHVDVTSAGTQVVDISASGINITTGSLKIAGVNGLSFPPDYTTDGSIAIGSGALAYQVAGTATPGTQGNTVIGYQAISSSGLTAAAVNNTAVGYQTLKANTSGNNNTAGGYQALQANTSGGGNTAYGELALENNQNGGNNTAIGLEALASNLSGGNNTAVGYYALINSTGGSNAAFGSNALQDNTGGASNTALGDAALYTNVSGNNNTAVGAAVGYGTLSSGSFNILIGVGTVGVAGGADTPASSTSNYLNIGNTIEGSMANASAVNRETLYLNSVASSVNYVKLSGGATGTGPTLAAAGTDTNVNLTISPQGTGNTLIPTGSVGIGLASPAVALDVSGTIRAGSFGSYLMPNGGSPNSYNQGIGINAYWNGSNWQLNTDSANNGGALMLSNEGAGDLRFYTIASAAAGVATGSQTIGSSTIGNYQRMVIQSNGNVGIGSAAPGAMLDVGGGINNTGNATLSSLNYSSTGPTVQVGDSQYGLSAAGGNLFLWTSSGGSYIFDIGTSTQAMVLTSSGKLGIGSTTPVVSLDLSQKSDAIALPVGTNGNRPTGTNLASGEIRYNTATPAAVEYYNGTTWVPLDSSGSSIGSGIVLGTSLTALNPTRNGDTTTGLYSANAGEVDVAGSGVQTTAFTGTGITINGQVAQTLGLFRETTAATAGNNLTVRAGGAVSVGTNMNGGNLILASGIATGTGSSNIQFTTYPAGNTGTADNTALTAATLSATGTLAAGTVNTTLQGATGIGTNINGGNLTLASGISTGTGTSSINFQIYPTGTSGATANSATTAMTIGTNGYVGIGTASPQVTLDVNGSEALPNSVSLYFRNSSATLDARIFEGAGSALNLQQSATGGIQFLNSAASALVVISSSGNVGIGTASPQVTLDVNGSEALANGVPLYFRNSSATLDARIFEGAGSALNLQQSATGGIQFLNSAASTLVEISSSGRIGIGSTTPLVSLDLSQEHDAIALPVGTNGNRPTGTNLASGEIRYNTATPAAVEYYNGTTWVPLDSSGSNIGSGIILGTSATVPNPYASATDTETGLYTAGAGKVDFTSAGTQVAEISTAGIEITTGSLMIAGVNGVSFPPDYTTDASIAIGSGALAHQPLGTSTPGTQANIAIGYQALGSSGLAATAQNNIAIGYQALLANTTGTDNIVFGVGNASLNSSGSNNLVIGNQSLLSNIAGGYNIALGYQVLQITTGSANIAIGSGAQASVGTGSHNVSLGGNAILGLGPGSALSGSYNLALGDSALYSLQGVAANNTAVGYYVGKTLKTGSSNILIGVGTVGVAGGADTPASSTSNYLNIGNTLEGNMANANAVGRETLYLNSVASSVNYVQMSGGATGTGPTLAAAGTDTNVNLTISPQGTGSVLVPAGSIGIGTTNPHSTLDVAGNVSLETNILKWGTSGSEDTGLSRLAAATLALGNGTSGDYSGTLVASKIGIGSTTPVVSLDLSQKSDAIALPVGTNSGRPTGLNLASGEIRYNTATPAAVEYYNGTTWVPLDSSGTSIGSGLVLGTSLTALNPTRNGDTTTGLYSANAGEVDVAGSGVQTAAITGTGITINGQGAQTLGLFRETTAATAGNNLTVQAGGAVSVGTNLNGGNLILASGIATGTGSSNIQFNTYNAGSTGTTDDAAFTALTLSATGATGTNAATTLQANAGSGTNQNGGTLTLASGVSTGTGTSNISFNVYKAGSTGAIANSATTAMTIGANGFVGIGTSTPAYALDVYSTSNGLTSRISGNNYNTSLLLTNTATGGQTFGWSSTGNGHADGNGKLILYNSASLTAGHEIMTIANGGNVGIGTTSPTSLLQTYDAAAQTANYTGVLHTVSDTSSTASVNKIGLDVESTGSWTGTSAVNTALVVNATGGTTNYAATFSGGNVGIGTTSPVSTLGVSGGVAIGTTYAGTNAAASNNLIVQGSVGIGTSSPASGALQVTPTLTNQDIIYSDAFVTATGTMSNYDFSPTTTVNYASGGTLSNFRAVPGYVLTQNFSSPIINVNNNTTIGGTNAYNLSNNVTANYLRLTTGSGYTGTIYGYIGAYAADIVIGTAGAAVTKQAGMLVENLSNATNNSGIVIGTNTIPNGNYGLYDVSANNNYLAGNVGIGSTSPLVSLDLSQEHDAIALPVGTNGNRPTGTNLASGEIRYNTATPAAVEYYNGTTWVPLDSSGSSIGSGIVLGTSLTALNPTRNGDTTTGLYSANAGEVDVAGSGVQTTAFTGTGITINGQVAQTLGLFRETTAATAGNNLTVRAGGAVSVGTNMNGGNLILASGIATGTGSSNIQFTTYPAGNTGTADNTALTAATLSATGTLAAGTVNTTLQGATGIGTNINGGNLTLASGISTGTGTSSINFQIYPTGTSGATANSATTAMTIGTNGYVGIGTTSPGAVLEVDSNEGESFHVRDTTSGDYFYVATNRSGAGYIDIGAYAGAPLPLVLNRVGGNVGIGTATPQNNLDVYGSVAVGTSYAGVNTAPTNGMIVVGSVGIGSTTPLVSLDLSQEHDAIALPVGTNGGRPTGPNLASGEIRYNTATPAVEYYNGTTWVPLDSSGSSIGSGIVLGTSVTVPNPYASATDTTTGLYTSGPGHVDVTVTGVQEMDWSSAGESLSGQSAQAIGMFRETTASTAGNNLTLQAGGAVSVGTNMNGGNLILASGIATGTGSSNIQFNTYNAGSTGTADDAAFTALTLSATGVTGVTPVTTLQANAGSGTNQNGGTLTLASGVSTGTGTSGMKFNIYKAGSTGATANSATTALTIGTNGYVGIASTSPTSDLTIGTSQSNASSPRTSIELMDTGYGNPTADGTYSNGDKYIQWNGPAGSGNVKNGIGNDAYGLFVQSSGISSAHFTIWTGPTHGSAPLERMRVDSSGNIGIGTSTMTSLLQTYDSAAKTAAYTGVLYSVLDTSSTASVNKVGMDVESTGSWTGTSAVNTGLVVNATGGTTNYAATFMGGYVGIGTTTPSYPLVVGTSSSNGNGAYLSTAGVWTNMSDRRLKENVRPIGYGLDAIMKLRPVAYDMIGSHDEQVGFIAQDVLKIVPEVVGVPKNPETEHYGLSYGNMVAVTVKALQELKALFDKDHGLLVKLHHLFDADHAEIEKLKAVNDNQAKSIDELRDMMLKQQQDFDEYKKAHP